ncbi:class I SAM-dependent methyltransferase [Thalassoroseus pseudoceratinae]|uniref:class I SAM-dependent methyltransferase n=1 Tax=Thalassoroseus pseudoceratinae TaxID=2713176 RepID=UPI0014237730|nr:class I SAM-dependent methyltransferase [Thalassoroseus pseudoceratinae]
MLTLLHEDPFTHRAFYKPRKYAGDAVMLDYIYGQEDYWPLPECTALGKQIFDYTTLAPASAGVRARRGYIADVLDLAAFETTRPHVLSIASGHFREAEMSAAIRRRRFGRVVALDADPQSLNEVETRYGRYGVETIAEPLMSLLKGTVDAGRFDLIYSLGLFDYLNEKIGRRLVTKAFEMLRPGGRLIVANFLPGIHDIGYMEAIMDWKLIYRTRQEMIGMTLDIPEEEIQSVALESEENNNIIFMTIRRKNEIK